MATARHPLKRAEFIRFNPLQPGVEPLIFRSPPRQPHDAICCVSVLSELGRKTSSCCEQLQLLPSSLVLLLLLFLLLLFHMSSTAALWNLPSIIAGTLLLLMMRSVNLSRCRSFPESSFGFYLSRWTADWWCVSMLGGGRALKFEFPPR